MSVIKFDNVAAINFDGQILCMECAQKDMDWSTVSSNDVITKEETRTSEAAWFCDECECCFAAGHSSSPLSSQA